MTREFEAEAGTTREELVERVALMEAMIAEGRQTTARFGWMFVMWGVIYFAATGWAYYLPHKGFAWPVCVMLGWSAGILWGRRRRRAGAMLSPRSRTIGAVWAMMGIGVSLFALFGGISHRAEHGIALYMAAIVFFVGLAHATSAAILRWLPQGMVAAIWWGGGIAILFESSHVVMLETFLTATFFGQIVFGLYVMTLEGRRSAAGRVLRHG